MTDHHIGQRLLVGILGENVSDVLALAQNRDAVRHIQHLVELVGDDDQRLAVGFHVAHDLEELICLLRGQNRGRFVENQDIGAAIEHLDNLNRRFCETDMS